MNKDEEIAAFAAVANELLTLLESLSEEQINRVPFPGSWTPGQLAEHLSKSFGAVDMAKVPSSPLERNAEEKSAQIEAVFLDDGTKYASLDFIAPATGKISGKEIIGDLRKKADGVVAFAKTHDLSFTCPGFDVIGFGPLTAQEWIHFLTAHGQRHLRQLRNMVSRA